MYEQARREGTVFPGPATFGGGGAQSLKNTEKGVPGGFFLTSNMHKIHFRRGEPTTLPRPLVGWYVRGIPPHVSSLSRGGLLDLGA